MTGIASYLKKHLTTHYIGRRLHYFEVTRSTMDIARDLAENRAPEGTVVIAGIQNLGRGRLGRSWLSPGGALATSIILYPPVKKIHLMPAISSLAAVRALHNMRLEAGIKWPNDVLIGGKKVCGILIENGFSKADLSYTVIGIGINVNFDTAAFPEISNIATSLSMQAGRNVPIEEVALQLYTELEKLYDRLEEADSIIREWASNMETLGRRVRVSLGTTTIEGMALELNESGNLIVRLDDGSTREITAGDVFHLRDTEN